VLFGEGQQDGGVFRHDGFERERFEEPGRQAFVAELPGETQRRR
jgi:hypothetical protein